MKNIDIALFLPSMRGGGAERVMLTLAKEFSRMGYSIQIVLSEKTGEYLEQIPSAIDVIDLKSKRVLNSIFPLGKYLKNSKPKVLLVTHDHANCIAVLANFFSGNKTNIFLREANTVSFNSKSQSNLIEKNISILIKLLYPFAKGIISVSKGVSDDLYSIVRHKNMTVIYNPVVDENLFKKAEEKVFHKWINKKEYPLVVAAGRLSEQKDFKTLINATSLAVKSGNPYRLIILGEGKLREELECLVEKYELKNYVDLPGFSDNPFAYMKRADLFVLSSLWEGLPNTLIQALSLGCKVVSTDCPSGPLEILQGGKYGSLVDCGDEYKLMDAITKCLGESNHDKDRQIQYCKEYFSVENISKIYLDLFNVELSELERLEYE